MGQVRAQVNRPVGGKDDQLLELKRNSEGAYEANVKLAGGIWDVTITAAKTLAGPFRLHKRITVSESAP
jgi:nitrogen fixation protein FixH